jgi:hypothetical protein
MEKLQPSCLFNVVTAAALPWWCPCMVAFMLTSKPELSFKKYGIISATLPH